MQFALIIGLAIHVLSAVFWAGSTFTLARTNGLGAQKIIYPQLGAALAAIVSGIFLWSTIHAGIFGIPEKVLALGVFTALIAFVLQATLGRSATLRQEPTPSMARGARVQRAAAALLAVTVICMAASRYV